MRGGVVCVREPFRRIGGGLRAITYAGLVSLTLVANC